MILTGQSRRTWRNRAREGVVPPMDRLAHSSSRSAPPRTAARAEAWESTQPSISGMFFMISSFPTGKKAPAGGAFS